MKGKKNVALILTATMLFSCMSGIVRADETEQLTEVTEETGTVEETETEEAVVIEEAFLTEETFPSEETVLTEETELPEETFLTEETSLTEETLMSEETVLTEETVITEETVVTEETSVSEEEIFEEVELEEEDVLADEGLYINEDTFPDPNFRSYVINTLNPEHDDYMTQSEVFGVTSINCSNRSIKNLKGLSNFTQLRILNVSGNPIADSVLGSTFLDCSSFTLLEELNCDDCGLGILVVKNLSRLTKLRCKDNNLISVDLTGCTALKEFNCANNKMTSVDMVHPTSLEILDCSNNELQSLGCTNTSKLKKLYADNNKLTSVILRGTKVETVFLQMNNLSEIDVTFLSTIKTLSIYGNNIKDFSIRGSAIEAEFLKPWSYELNWDSNVRGYVLTYRLNNGGYLKCDFKVRVDTELNTDIALDAPSSVDIIRGDNDKQVIVSWTDVEHADGYRIFRRLVGETGWIFVNDAGASTSYVDTVIDYGEYDYAVCAYYTYKDGSTFAEGIRCQTDYTLMVLPYAPAAVTARDVSIDSVNLTWDPVPGADGYEVARAKGTSGSFVVLGCVTSNQRNCTNLERGTTYTFRVRSYVIQRDKKVYSEPVTFVVTTSLLTAPVMNISRINANNTNFRISWTSVTGATGYVVERATSKNGPFTRVYSGKNLSYTDSSTSAGVLYYYRVRAANNGAYSTLRMIMVPNAPTGLRITATSRNSISLTWNKVSGTSVMYEIWRSRNKTSGYVCLGRYTENSKVSTSLNPNTTYYYKVRAYFYYYDSNGEIHRVYSNYTPVISGTTKK